MTSTRMFLCLTLVSVCLALTLAQDTDLQYSLPEEKPVGTFVANIASDGRLLINVTDAVFNQLRYQLLTEGNMYAKLFTMNEQTGQLETAEKIDRESVCQGLVVCNLGLFVNVFKDDPDFPNNPVLIKYLRIHVMLQDINDHEPVFPNPEVVVSVSEIVNTGYVIPISAATDQDSGANNSVRTYEFVNLQDVFQLKVQTDLNSVLTLEIEVIKNLDYEMVKYYQLEILAKDGGIPQKSGNVTVHINVLDENDNFPMFTKSEYTATTIENQKLGVVIVQVTATDIDSGNKGNVSYRFNPSSVPSAFGINATTGEIYVAGEIDYETDDSFSFFVQAVDQGAQPRISSTVVLINVTDVNDNAPQVSINLPPGGDMISEATEAGSYIANVAVSDPDSGAFGNITCHLQSEFFRMETLYINMYKVILNKSLDRESRPVHNVSVLCADGGSPNLVTMSSFLISVGDVNDNQPTFTFDLYNVSLYENNAIGTPITIVTAVDKDQGENGRLTYSLHDDVDGLFSINSNSGVISANVVFDRETRTQVQFRVVATDNNAVAQLSSTATIVVMIIDKNDNKPSFSQQLYSFNIPENQVAGTVIGRVYVYDKDIGANGQIHFTQSHPYTSIFEVIQSTGQIQTKIVLDREIQGVYDFKLTALDNGVPALQTTTHVVIVIEDVNDNVPNVTFPSAHNNTVAITPGKSQGALVTKVMASDPDLGANSHLTYLVIKGGAGLFQVDNRTGVVVTEQALTQDHIGTYTLLLAIQDGGTPSQTTWSNLVILVADDDANQNMIIVIAVVSVTVTLSIGMIIMICLIRRQDGHKHHPDQSTFTEHKKKFILEWLHCLSTSTHDVQKLGTDKADTQIHRPTDLKPIMISSKDSTTTEGSHDGTNHGSKENVGKTDEDEGFVETPGGTLSHDSGRGDSIRTRHDSSMSQLMTSQDSRQFHSLPRVPTGSEIVSGQRSSTSVSDGVSIPESWQHGPMSLRPGYARNFSLDEQLLRDRSLSTFRDDSRFSIKDSCILPLKKGNRHHSDTGLGYDNRPLQGQLPGRYPHQRPSYGTPGMLAQKRTLPTISATPEPSDGGFNGQSISSSSQNHPRSPSGHLPYTGVHFFKSRPEPKGPKLCHNNYATDTVMLERETENRLNAEDCIV